MRDKVKVAFIGSGGIVQSHLEHGLKDFPDVEFVGWCDLNEKTAAARRQQVGGGGNIYRDARQMLDETRPDAVYIMLPPFAHGAAEKLVIERKLPFFVEKPVALDLASARSVQEGVQKHTAQIDLPNGEHITIPGEPNVFALEDRAFIDSVKAGKSKGILAIYEDGLKATAIACAANESMTTGQVITLSP